MSSLSSKVVVLAFASVAIASQACTLASPTEVQLVPAKQDSDATEAKTKSTTGTTPSTKPASTCKLAKIDVTKLTACGDNNEGHCYPKSKVPGGGAQSLACATADEICVPDVILKAGGDKLATCTVSVLKAAGVCGTIGTLAESPEKDLAKSNLKQDGCDEGLVCEPCVDVRDGSDTGLCGAVGVSEDDCTGDGATTTAPTNTTPAATCCGGKGTCLDGAKLGDAASSLGQDSCASDTMVCAPASLITGKATKCDSLIGSGICMDACFNSLLAVGGLILGQSTCTEGESCIPCLFASKMAPDGAQVPGCEDE